METIEQETRLVTLANAVRERIPGASVEAFPFNENIWLDVFWEGFHRMNVPKRQKHVRKIVKNLDLPEARIVTGLITLTPDEAEDEEY